MESIIPDCISNVIFKNFVRTNPECPYMFLRHCICSESYILRRHCPESSATGMGQFPICKLKWDFLRTSVTACTIDKDKFSAPFGIFYVRTENWKEIFQKKVLYNLLMHISRRGGHILFFIFPHFWLVSKACNVSRGILLKKMKKNHFEYENLQIKTLN